MRPLSVGDASSQRAKTPAPGQRSSSELARARRGTDAKRAVQQQAAVVQALAAAARARQLRMGAKWSACRRSLGASLGGLRTAKLARSCARLCRVRSACSSSAAAEGTGTEARCSRRMHLRVAHREKGSGMPRRLRMGVAARPSSGNAAGAARRQCPAAGQPVQLRAQRAAPASVAAPRQQRPAAASAAAPARVSRKPLWRRCDSCTCFRAYSAPRADAAPAPPARRSMAARHGPARPARVSRPHRAVMSRLVGNPTAAPDAPLPPRRAASRGG